MVIIIILQKEFLERFCVSFLLLFQKCDHNEIIENRRKFKFIKNESNKQTNASVKMLKLVSAFTFQLIIQFR